MGKIVYLSGLSPFVQFQLYHEISHIFLYPGVPFFPHCEATFELLLKKLQWPGVQKINRKSIRSRFFLSNPARHAVIAKRAQTESDRIFQCHRHTESDRNFQDYKSSVVFFQFDWSPIAIFRTTRAVYWVLKSGRDNTVLYKKENVLSSLYKYLFS